MKAQSHVLSHMIYLVLGFAAITLIFFSLSNLSSTVKRGTLEIQSEYIAEAVKSEIMHLYSDSENSNFLPDQSAVLEVSELNLPEKLSQGKYTIYLSKNTITVESYDMEINRSINVDIDIEGFSSLPAYLKLERVNNNGIPLDKITLVGK